MSEFDFTNYTINFLAEDAQQGDMQAETILKRILKNEQRGGVKLTTDQREKSLKAVAYGTAKKYSRKKPRLLYEYRIAEMAYDLIKSGLSLEEAHDEHQSSQFVKDEGLCIGYKSFLRFYYSHRSAIRCLKEIRETEQQYN